MVGIGFCGASVTTGTPNIEDSECYATLVSNHFKPNLFLNYAEVGAGNRHIFIQAMKMILTDVDYIFVQWSFPGRQRWQSAFKKSVTIPGSRNVLDNILTDSRYQTFIDVFKIVDSTYNQYFELNDQITILNTICKKLNKSVYYINGGIHIDPVLIDNTEISSAQKNLLPYTKEVIDLHSLPDSDIEQSIKELQNKLSVINVEQWVSLEKMQVLDRGYDGEHPGPQSHRAFAMNVIKFLEDKMQ